MTRAAGVAWIVMSLDAGVVLAGPPKRPPPLSLARDLRQAKMQLKVGPAVACKPVVLGKRCQFELSVTNLSKDVVVAHSLTTDRPADSWASYLRDRYGSLSEQRGKLILNSLAQQATPKVFFGTEALLLPGEKKTFSVVTRLFGAPRKLTFRSIRIAVPELGQYLYAQQGTTKDEIPGGPEQVFPAVMDLEGLKRSISSDALRSLVLWNSAALAPDEVEVQVSAKARDPGFGLKAARVKLPAGPATEQVSFSDNFRAWLFGAPGGTWLVREQGAELLGQVDFAVFEKIDDVQAKDVRFGVPEQAFRDQGYKLESGDGMYTHGTFLTASGDELLGVLRVAKEKALRAAVHYYFFSSWYIALTPAVPASISTWDTCCTCNGAMTPPSRCSKTLSPSILTSTWRIGSSGCLVARKACTTSPSPPARRLPRLPAGTRWSSA